MPELFIPQQEKHEALLDRPRIPEALPTAAQAEALRPGEADPLARLEAARDAIEQIPQADPLERLQAAETAAVEPVSPATINRELKQITLYRELKHIQRKLTVPERSLSKFMHQPVIRRISEPASKSISRPSGLLGGGLVALIGSSSYLCMARYLGFEYNYLVFLMLFTAGFLLGISLELLVHFTARSRHQDN